MKNARFYVEHFEEMKAGNIGYLLWGNVGTGKSYFAGCIANALMEKEIPVRMTNFALILNNLTASFEGRNEYIDRLCRFPPADYSGLLMKPFCLAYSLAFFRRSSLYGGWSRT